MAISMYAASVPVFQRTLDALAANLGKAAAYCSAKKIEPEIFLGLRLIPDMLPFAFQIRTAADFAKNTAARLAGAAPQKFEDTEKSIDELIGRLGKTVALINTYDRAAIDASSDRAIEFPLAGTPMRMRGEDYLLHFSLPNLYFHSTMAYAIMREAGIEVGKRDFMGQVPGLTPV